MDAVLLRDADNEKRYRFCAENESDLLLFLQRKKIRLFYVYAGRHNITIAQMSSPRLRLPLCGVGVREEMDVCWEVGGLVMQALLASV